ncbi:MAG: pseudouridine-5'-phosphate glycosidase [Pseudomonadota bacterium]
MTGLPLRYAPEVARARETGRPIVALESTIITHGLPAPENLQTAQRLEEVLRRDGVTPATIAVLEGRLCIGLTPAELDALARAPAVAKLSRADLAVCLATGGTGATTVAATMIAARAAGIAVFATGGIGGVHPGAEQSFDISADLHELARTPVTVVSAGAKAILDLPGTLEVLETLGVPVIAFGQDELPAFWSARSGLRAPLRLDSAADIARAHRMRAALGLPGGQLVANPVPAAHHIPRDQLAPLIAQATAEVRAQAITGKAVTPAVLARLRVLSGGRTLSTNIALVENNAGLAAKIALSLAA